MTNIFDVPAGDLIEEIAKEFEKNSEIKEPSFVNWVKSGSHRERAPHRKEWWYLRLASILYQTYKSGLVGTGRLRTYYGGRKARGVRKHRFRKSGGKIIRLSLQTLEQQGFIKKAKKGRTITAKGEKFLALKAKETMAGLGEKRRLAQENAIQREKERTERESKEKRLVEGKKTEKDKHKKREKKKKT
ncbi:30S ribosomal protein S19e [Candidatus Micrarchaeota archaeon]|nr:30S ribosomal protein S19e [Candidatus Micrarchaeota archaeon]MBU1929920.1 30S ribosomal protein S19e [Candidatus Micrarchaeota archaeon]